LKDPTAFSGAYGLEPPSPDSGAAYLRSLKQYQDSAPEAITSEPVLAPASTPGTNPPERRRSERHKCQGSARFRSEEDVVHTYGTLTDVSLHGCYVEMMATSPVGTKVNMLLEVNSIRAAVHGVVRVSYPFLGMGIEFTGLDPQAQQALHEMTVSLMPRVNAIGSPSKPDSTTSSEPLLIPIITDPAAALSAIANFFQDQTSLSRQEFLRLIQKSQGSR
jgi:hypothetical protein